VRGQRSQQDGTQRRGYPGRVSDRAGYDDEVLPEQASDDTDRGWGDERRDEDRGEDADLERLRREKPPHW